MDRWETGEGLHMLRVVCVKRMRSHFSLSHCVPSRVIEVSYFSFKICFSLFYYTAYVWEFPSKSKWDLPSAQTRGEKQVLLFECWPGRVVCFNRSVWTLLITCPRTVVGAVHPLVSYRATERAAQTLKQTGRIQAL